MAGRAQKGSVDARLLVWLWLAGRGIGLSFVVTTTCIITRGVEFWPGSTPMWPQQYHWTIEFFPRTWFTHVAAPDASAQRPLGIHHKPFPQS